MAAHGQSAAPDLAFDSGRKQHGYSRAVRGVIGAVKLHEIALFKEDADQNVAGGRNRKNQVPDRHMWSRPEGDQKA